MLAYEEFGGSSRVAGVFFGSFGAGAVVGMVVAMRMMPRVDPIRLAATSLVALTLPIWLLLADLPAWGVVGALFVSRDLRAARERAAARGAHDPDADRPASEGDDRA